MKKGQKKQNKDEKVTSEKKTSKLLGVFVMIGGALSLVLMIVFATKFTLPPTDVKKPVLGVTINGAPTNTNFNDPAFYACIINELNNKNIDGVNSRGYTHEATENELELMTELSCSRTTDDNKIISTSGLNLMKNLTRLFLSDNEITSIDLSGNTKLETINLAQNNLTSIDIKPIKNTIKEIHLDNNKNLAEITWGALFNKLEVLSLQETNLEAINTALARNLRELSLANNPQLIEVGISANTMEILKLSNTGISTLSLDGGLAVSLKTLWLDNTPNLTHTTTHIDERYGDINVDNGLSGINIFPKLEELLISKSQITNIDFGSYPDISGVPSLKKLWIKDMPKLTNVIGLESSPELTYLTISETGINSIAISNNTKLINMNLSNNDLTAVSLSNQPNLTSLNLSGNKLTSTDMTNNTKLNEINLSNNPNLKGINNSLSKIDFSNNIALRKLYISNSGLASIDLTKNIGLTTLDLSYNDLKDIDLSANKSLIGLFLSNNNLTSVDVVNNTRLRTLQINNSPKLTSLGLGSNIENITNDLSLTNSPLLSHVAVHNNNKNYEFNPSLNLLKIELGFVASSIDSGVIGRVKRALTENSSTITSTGIVDKNGTPLVSDAKLKTGDIIRGLYDGGSVDIALYSPGDVAPNGKVDYNDVLKLFRHYKGFASITSDAEIEAGKVVANGEITFDNVLKLFRYYKGYINEL